MSDPNAPRFEGSAHDPSASEPATPGDARLNAPEPTEGFAVTGEQHATPSAPAVGEPAQPFTSTDAAAPQATAPGQPAFGAPAAGGPGAGQSHAPSGPQYGAPTQPSHGAPGQPPYGAPSQPQYGAPSQPQYGAPGPQHGTPAPPPYAAGAPMSPVDEKNAGMWGHLAGLSTIVTGGGGGWIGPLIVYMIYKDRSAFAKQEAKESLNFGILMTIVMVGMLIVGTVLSFIGIGVIFLGLWWVPGLLQTIFSIIGAVKVNEGGSYRYPFNWRVIS